MKSPRTLAEARALDRADPLGAFRERFVLPERIIYLVGNSLGPLPKITQQRLSTVIADEWGHSLVRSWNDHDWIGAPQRIGAKLAGLIGAQGDEVILADSTSINLFKLVVAVGRNSPDRGTILSETGNFPTDLHVARGAAELLGKRLVAVETDRLSAFFTTDVAALVLSHVHYRTSYRHDLRAITAEAKAQGIPVIWDLSHSAGAIPLDLGADGAELAVGCGYKYLNGGPGAPAFIYVARRLQPLLAAPVPGWFGHSEPFGFSDQFQPADGMSRFLTGTPPMLSLLALETGIDLARLADPAALFEKSQALFKLFGERMAKLCPEMRLVSPRDASRRGSHIAFAHPAAGAIINALAARGVIGDFRAPDLARFGLTPLYIGFEDVWNATDIAGDIMASGVWREPRFAAMGRVT